MAAEMKCPSTGQKCLVDPIELEGRLVRIETKLDRIIQDNTDNKKTSAAEPAQGVSCKGLLGFSTLISGLVVGIIEGVKAYLSARGN